MKPLTVNEIIQLQRPIQHFSDCYLVTSIGALARSQNGQKILSQNIAHEQNGFRITFQNIHDCVEDYFVSQGEILRLTPLDKYYEEAIVTYPQNPIIKAIEVAMNKLLKLHPDKKPFISRLMKCQEKFEYNKPSNFLKMFTGKKPIILNESSLKMSLPKDEAIELLERIDKADDFSFIAGTGISRNDDFPSLHCYTVEGVNSENQYLQVYESRNCKSIELPFEKALKIFKYLTGYLNV